MHIYMTLYDCTRIFGRIYYICICVHFWPLKVLPWSYIVFHIEWRHHYIIAGWESLLVKDVLSRNIRDNLTLWEWFLMKNTSFMKIHMNITIYLYFVVNCNRENLSNFRIKRLWLLRTITFSQHLNSSIHLPMEIFIIRTQYDSFE